MDGDALGIEHRHCIVPALPRAETGDRAIAGEGNRIQALEIHQDALAPNTRPARIGGVTAAPDRKLDLEEICNLYRSRHVCRIFRLNGARRVGVACFGPFNVRGPTMW
jgi:hypothetical protein